jgi:hypothetical protein
MDQKLYQSQQHIGPHGGGVYKSVEREGVLNPVQMVHGMSNSLLMGQGHHRTAAAEDIERKRGRDVWVPVVHTDAREHSPTPVDIYSDVNEKRAAIQDYHNWRTTTPALGLDVGWLQAREDAE